MLAQIYYRNGNAYLIKRKIPVHNFEKNEQLDLDFVKMWRDYLDCDHVLRDQTHFIFVETIQDVDYEELF